MAHDGAYKSGRGGHANDSRMRKFCRAIYNPDEKTVFGRTKSSWAKIITFYLVFYSCLAGFFSVCMYVFFQTIDDVHPTMTGMYSLIKQNPGMGFRPQTSMDSTLVQYKVSDLDSYSVLVGDITKFLKDNGYVNDKYEPVDAAKDSNGKDVFDISALNKSCSINTTHINSSFGYAEGKPCVLLKINKVYDWMPEPFDNESLTTDRGMEAKEALGERLSQTDIGVSCEGENDGDIDSLGQVDFFPEHGFPFAYYPYLNADNHRAPIVFAKFSNAKKGVLIQVWCKMWAKNVMHHKVDRAGSIRFELLIDN